MKAKISINTDDNGVPKNFVHSIYVLIILIDSSSTLDNSSGDSEDESFKKDS